MKFLAVGCIVDIKATCNTLLPYRSSQRILFFGNTPLCQWVKGCQHLEATVLPQKSGIQLFIVAVLSQRNWSPSTPLQKP
jgi:hypothetical protein